MIKIIIKICILIALLYSLFITITPKSFADEQVLQNYDVNYTISENAITHVSIDAKLTNLTKTFYTSSYKLSLGITDIQKLKANSSDSEIDASVEKNSTGSTVVLKFNNRVVGINKSLTFNISFDTTDITKNYKHIWEINIPGIENENGLTYQVNVTYPKILGIPTFIKPYSYTFASDSAKLNFTKSDLKGSGVSVTFGKGQIYNLDLDYHLENKNLISVLTEIALPPDTNYQSVEIDSLVPKPVNVVRDDDGNWIATYRLSPSQKLDVNLKGKVMVNLTPKEETMPSVLKAKYLSSQKYWDTQNPKIIELAKKLKTPEKIYDYVVRTLNYNYKKLENDNGRLGASKVLLNPDSAVCLEFTDLFIAISRAAGIPAREIDGYAFTSNKIERPSSLVKDILHAWPEYYDFNSNKWIMVDPTWGKTTGGVDYLKLLDFDHIAFAIRGINSSYPIPAGGYRQSRQNLSKDIRVTIGDKLNEKLATASEVNFSSTYIAGIPVNGIITVINKGNTEINNKNVNVFTQNLIPRNQNLLTSSIPPFGKEDIKVKYNAPAFLTNTKDVIKISLDNKDYSRDVLIKPFFAIKSIQIGGVLVVSFIIVISVIAYGFRRISISRRKK